MSRPPVALVTGASAGIGQAIVGTLLEAGYRVVAAARRRERLEIIAREGGERLHPLVLDVEDGASTATLLDRLPQAWRAIEVLVNNAGHDRGGRRRFHEAVPEDFESVMQTNVIGLMRVTHALLPGMLARRHGHVVNIGSVSGFEPYATGTVYAASKFAVHGFSESLRLDYPHDGIRVTEILPGTVRTEFARERWLDEAVAEQFYAGQPQCLDSADVAAAVAYALSQPAHVDVAQVVITPRPVVARPVAGRSEDA